MASAPSKTSSNDLLESADIIALNDSLKPTDDLDSIPMNLLPAGNCEDLIWFQREYTHEKDYLELMIAKENEKKKLIY